jgi:hypothetical protein
MNAQRLTAWERAKAAGVDVSLLESNLRLTISERLHRHDAALNAVKKLRKAVEMQNAKPD